MCYTGLQNRCLRPLGASGHLVFIIPAKYLILRGDREMLKTFQTSLIKINVAKFLNLNNDCVY